MDNSQKQHTFENKPEKVLVLSFQTLLQQLLYFRFRIIDIVYNACNNELVRTKTLVKNAIVVIDATPFRQW